MTQAVQQLITSFERLSSREKQEAMAEIFCLAMPPATDESGEDDWDSLENETLSAEAFDRIAAYLRSSGQASA